MPRSLLLHRRLGWRLEPPQYNNAERGIYLDFVFGTVSSEDTHDEDYLDYVMRTDGGKVALTYDNSRTAAVHYSAPYGAGSPEVRMVYLAFTFETINQPADRAQLMKSVLEFFSITTRVRRAGDLGRRRLP